MVLPRVESFTEKEGHFEICGLRNEFVEIRIVPELGGRILSLRDRRSGREWMDRPRGQALFRNDHGDDFSKGTFAGADECLPTIEACRWEDRDLPDHGEIWALGWNLDEALFREGRIRSSVDLPISPLCFERTVTLDGPHVKLAYRLTSSSDQPERWLWAFHPLYPLCPGDRLELPGKAPAPECAPGACAKVFYPATEGRVSLVRASGNRLTTTWSPAELPWLAVWITRGGWHGHHHLALEPTVAPADTPDHSDVPMLAPGATTRWSLTLTTSA